VKWSATEKNLLFDNKNARSCSQRCAAAKDVASRSKEKNQIAPG
jgi:hypothetical protein